MKLYWLCFCLVPATGLGVARTMHASELSSGIDRTGFNEKVRPQDDFNAYVNGGWIEATEIPADKSWWGSFAILREESDKHQLEIITSLAAHTDRAPGSEAQKVGDLYTSLMDEERINALGYQPIVPLLNQIDAIATREDLFRVMGELRQYRVTSPLVQFINVDSGDSQKYAVYLTQSGLGLPNRNYYLKEGAKFDEIRSKYPAYIAQMFTLADIDNGEARAQGIVDLEMKIAEAQWSPEDSRDADKTNNRYAVSDLNRVSNQINWNAFLGACGLGDLQEIFVRQPSFFTDLGGMFAETPLETWKDYLRFHLIEGASPWMSEPFAVAQFEFNGKLINGQEEMQPRWQRSVQTVNGVLGEAVGKLYVEKHFPEEAKVRMDALVDNLIKAFEISINELDWMTEATKAKAQEKRAKLVKKIGYPKVWKDYTQLEIKPDDALGNLARAGQWDYERRLARLNEPVDREEWFMTPQTVNAYHNPRMNEIVFPAAILRPPFFFLDADEAVNYGAIGAVIGHEIGHAFDDQGRKTDAYGNLNEWWTEDDAKAFEAKAGRLVEQYNQFEVLDSLFVNGELTLGENIGDLTGLTIGYEAYKMSLNGKEPPVIDGLTGEQRYMMGFAQMWRAKAREEAIRRQVMTDPHSPAAFRTNGPLRNFDPFYEVFGVKEGDGMYLPPEERVSIW